MTKINKLKIKGLRGIKKELTLDLSGNSILIYGDNGSGKSSIADSIEWFYKDYVSHLSTGQIDNKRGLTALRNRELNENEDSSLEIIFGDSKLNSTKVINSQLKSSFVKKDRDFDEYIQLSEKENLFLRFRNLERFIIASRNDRLTDFSSIIGFEEILKKRRLFKKIKNGIFDTLRNRDFDNEINKRRSHLVEHLNEAITSESTLVNAINKLLATTDITLKISKIVEVETVLKEIEKKSDNKLSEIRLFYSDVAIAFEGFESKIEKLESMYEDYYKKSISLINDKGKLNQLYIIQLLDEAKSLIQNKNLTNNECPLCLQPKDLKELLNELEKRINELSDFKKIKQELTSTKSSLKQYLDSLIFMIKTLTANKNIIHNISLKEKLDTLGIKLQEYILEVDKNILEELEIKKQEGLLIEKGLIQEIIKACKQEIKEIEKKLITNSTHKTHSTISLSCSLYKEINRLEREKSILQNQHESLENIYNEFIKKQKEGLENFLHYFSQEISSLYFFMNPDENANNFKLTTTLKDDEFEGLSIEFRFFDKTAFPPHKYLSESHINCLGIAFFLASMKAFNKKNKFFILDDVISSFDTKHRLRFGLLLREKFSDYQIIILTHESQWFHIFSNMIKGAGWIIKEIKWSPTEGSYLDEAEKELGLHIEDCISKGNSRSLGNDIRKYLEGMIKKKAQLLCVQVDYLPNNRNASRMPGELISGLKGRFSNFPKLRRNEVIERLLLSNFIATLESHDNEIDIKDPELKSTWQFIKDFESLFFCIDCKSGAYYEKTKKVINCKCGKVVFTRE